MTQKWLEPCVFPLTTFIQVRAAVEWGDLSGIIATQTPDRVGLVVSFQQGALGAQTASAGLSQYREEVAGSQRPLKFPICHSVTQNMTSCLSTASHFRCFYVWWLQQGIVSKSRVSLLRSIELWNCLTHTHKIFSPSFTRPVDLFQIKLKWATFPVSQREGLRCSVVLF